MFVNHTLKTKRQLVFLGVAIDSPAPQSPSKARRETPSASMFVQSAAASFSAAATDSLNAHVRARVRYVECVRAEFEAQRAPHATSWPALMRVLPSVAALPGVRADAQAGCGAA